MAEKTKTEVKYNLNIGRRANGKIAFSKKENLELGSAIENARKALTSGAKEVILTEAK